ncbi:MAG: amidohydrolase [Acetobacteraceae bacterium]|nr:amidohydrolase [Acetobacteraceae bacterium]
MNVDVLNRSGADPKISARLMIADGDIHPRITSAKVLYPWLAKKWQDHFEMFGPRHRQAWEKGPAYPKMQPLASRRDAWTPEGKPPGSDLPFMRHQLLDACNVEMGVLNPLNPSGQGFQNQEMGAAFARAVNEWQVAEWTSKEPRLKGSIVSPYEDAELAVKEIQRWAGDKNFVQILLLSRANEPLGAKRYWPIYAAAQEAGLPIGIHAFGYSGSPVTSSGWPSYYIEEMVGHAVCAQAGLTSMVIEGVFERFPGLRVVSIEAGVAWAPALMWRLDAQWKKLKAETPFLKKAPSEYLRTQVWWTSQPIEEPEPRERMGEMLDWMGWDRLIFATDYPHWDFDDPAFALPFRLTDAQRRAVFRENARGLYGC